MEIRKVLAHLGNQYHCNTKVFVPQTVSLDRIKSIYQENGEIILVDGNYDKTLQIAKKESELNNWKLITNNTWDGYTQIPMDIMCGYSTIFREFELQYQQFKHNGPITHLMIQAGTGGLAACASIWSYLNKNNTNIWCKDLKMIIVEPMICDGIYQKVQNGVNTDIVYKNYSTMTGLNCVFPVILLGLY